MKSLLNSYLPLSRIAIIVILFFILFPQKSLHAQENKDSLNYNIGLSLSGRRISGTFKQSVIGGGLNVVLKNSKWEFNTTLTYRFNKTNNNKIEDNWFNFSHLSYFPNAKRKLYPISFYHFDNNLMFRIEKRHRYGAGIGSNWEGENAKIRLVVGSAYELTSFDGTSFINSENDTSERKTSLFLVWLNNEFKLFNNRLNISNRLFYMQSLKESADYDIWVATKVSFKIFSQLSIFANYDYRFENVYIEGLSSYNDMLLFGLNWKFKN